MKKQTRPVRVRSLVIGGGAPVSIQGMTKVPTAGYAALRRQAASLKEAGAELVRVAVRDERDLASFARLRREFPDLPLAADIHFRAALARGALEAGADKIRLNPGNISDRAKLSALIRLAASLGAAVRVGVNAGSLAPPPGSARKRPENAARAIARSMVAAAAGHIAVFEAEGFRDIIVSLKSSSVPVTVMANRLFRRRYDYPLHIGVTEAGAGDPALVKSAAGIGALLADDIGETVRVSLSAPPEAEITAARHILQALGIRRFFPEIISCPTCGRCRVPLFAIRERVEQGVRALPGWPGRYAGLRIAVMGCEVNGPGEAAEADLGLAAGARLGLVFSRGRVIDRVPADRLAERLLAEIVRAAAPR